MTINYFINEILENNNTSIIIFDSSNDNIIYNGCLSELPECLLNREIINIKTGKTLFLNI